MPNLHTLGTTHLSKTDKKYCWYQPWLFQTVVTDTLRFHLCTNQLSLRSHVILAAANTCDVPQVHGGNMMVRRSFPEFVEHLTDNFFFFLFLFLFICGLIGTAFVNDTKPREYNHKRILRRFTSSFDTHFCLFSTANALPCTSFFVPSPSLAFQTLST